MSTFSESGLQFTFPEDWLVYKYDEHRFYRYVSGYGLKGVDFMIITPQEELILLEVKNYYKRYERARYSPTLPLFDNPQAYAKIYLGKYQDSFRLIRGIYEYYESRHRYRWLVRPLFRYLPEGLKLKTDWGFWSYANALLDRKSVSLLLWLELNPEFRVHKRVGVEATIAGKIRAELPDYPFQIGSTDKNHLPFQVKRKDK